jgi:hypothetical protein
MPVLHARVLTLSRSFNIDALQRRKRLRVEKEKEGGGLILEVLPHAGRVVETKQLLASCRNGGSGAREGASMTVNATIAVSCPVSTATNRRVVVMRPASEAFQMAPDVVDVIVVVVIVVARLAKHRSVFVTATF